MTTTIRTDDGVGLAVERIGEGPPFLMVHGFTGAKEDFADHAPRFAEHSQVVRFDHRGHGASEKPPDVAAYSLDRLAADTIEVADALGLERFTLLGHSMGGMVARRLVLAHPERVDALVLMDTSPGTPPGIDPDQAELAAAGRARPRAWTCCASSSTRRTCSGRKPINACRRERLGYVEFAARKWGTWRRRRTPRSHGS